MRHIITSIFLFNFLIVSAQNIRIQDISINKADSMQLPDTIYCVYGTIVSNSNYNYIDYYQGVMNEETHYFANQPRLQKIMYWMESSSEMETIDRIELTYSFYIFDENLKNYLDNVVVIYLDEEANVITKKEHEFRVNLFDNNMQEIKNHYQELQKSKKN